MTVKCLKLAFPPAHEATLFPRRDDVDGSNNALLNNLVGIDISDTPRIDAHKAENKAQKAEDEAQKAEDEAQKADDELQKANKADQRENGQAASKNTDSPLPSLLKGL